MGYYFRAIKESHDVAEVLGVNVVRYRLIAIMLSAFLSAMAGTFYAQYVLYIDPESVMLLAISIQIVLLSMLGRRRHGHGSGDRGCRPDSDRRSNTGLARSPGDRCRHDDLRFYDYDHIGLSASGCVGILFEDRKQNKMNKAICLEVKGMTKWFGGLAANYEIDFIIEEGEIVSIIGPNGAGKSTLFNCIMGFYKPDAGKVSFYGKDIYRLRADKSVNWALPGRSRLFKSSAI